MVSTLAYCISASPPWYRLGYVCARNCVLKEDAKKSVSVTLDLNAISKVFFFYLKAGEILSRQFPCVWTSTENNIRKLITTLGACFKNQSACDDFQEGYTGHREDAAVMDDTHTETKQLAEERTR